jgi:hypothetical protein
MTLQQSIDFNTQTGKNNRDAGIERAVKKANKDINKWSHHCWKFFLLFLAQRSMPFLIEDFREWVKDDLQAPDNLRAYGFIPLKAAREGLIERIGTSKVKNANANCANAALWKKI